MDTVAFTMMYIALQTKCAQDYTTYPYITHPTTPFPFTRIDSYRMIAADIAAEWAR